MKTINTQHFSLSYMTGKLKCFHAINTDTTSNEFCQKMQKSDAVCKACYSQSMMTSSRKNCVKPWKRNSDNLSGSILPISELPIINAHSFRFHGHGELINIEHFINLVNVAVKNPHTNFSLWTKRKNIISQYVKKYGSIPGNLIMIYSNPSLKRIINVVPKNFHKVFNVSETGKISGGQFECTGKSCMDCLACYRKNDLEIIVEKLK